REALRAAGIAPRPELEIEAELGYEQGAEVLGLLLAREPAIDAVFFTGDVWAMGALFECQRRAIPVPGRIAILGFDDQEFAGQTVPALSTVRVPRYEMGWEAGRLLHAELTGAVVRRRRLDLGFTVVVRETT